MMLDHALLWSSDLWPKVELSLRHTSTKDRFVNEEVIRRALAFSHVYRKLVDRHLAFQLETGWSYYAQYMESCGEHEL